MQFTFEWTNGPVSSGSKLAVSNLNTPVLARSQPTLGQIPVSPCLDPRTNSGSHGTAAAETSHRLCTVDGRHRAGPPYSDLAELGRGWGGARPRHTWYCRKGSHSTGSRFHTPCRGAGRRSQGESPGRGRQGAGQCRGWGPEPCKCGRSCWSSTSGLHHNRRRRSSLRSRCPRHRMIEGGRSRSQTDHRPRLIVCVCVCVWVET